MVFDPATPSLGDFYRDEILPRLTAERVYTHPAHEWKPAGDRWRGACPRHRSASGSSFVVTLDNRLWWCEGCQAGGGPVQYLWWLRGRDGSPWGGDFLEIVRELAARAGVAMPERELSAEERAAAEARAARQSALETVYRACRDELRSAAGAAARSYLHGRGLPNEAIRDLELGLYPAVEAVRRALARAGHAATPLEGAWGKLAGYATFPWRDEYGHALTLYGCWPGKAAPDGGPKTLALPGEHSKSSPLYFDRARRAGRRDLVLVEGVLDAAMAQSRGVPEVVAYVAASPSRDQLATLERQRVGAVTICGDPDSGGGEGPALAHQERRPVDPGVRRAAVAGRHRPG